MPFRKLSYGLLDSLQKITSRAHQRSVEKYNDTMMRLALEILFKPRPDDIYISTYPKSGTTMMQMMLCQLATGEVEFPHIETVSPWFESALLMGDNATLEAFDSPRLFKTHLFWEELPRTGRYIYVVRNVRDVAVSTYYHSCLLTGLDLELEKFLGHFLTGYEIPWRTWFAHAASWWPHRHDDNVLFLIYEEVIADVEGTVRRVAEFCGFEIDEDRMPLILERLTVAFMKEHEARFDPRLRRMVRMPETPLSEIARPGAGHGLAPPQEAMLQDKLRELAKELGVDPEDPTSRLFFNPAPAEEPPAEEPPAEAPAEKPASVPPAMPARAQELVKSLEKNGRWLMRLSNFHHALRRKIARDHLCRPRSDDLFVAGYPGSGLALVRMMLHQLLAAPDSDGTLQIPHIETASPWYDVIVHAGDADHLEALSSPRVFTTCLRHSELPPGARAVYVLRDPRDVARAGFERHRLIYGVEGMHQVFVDQFITKRHGIFGSWFEHTASWWPHRHDDGVLFLLYEEVFADPAGTVRKLAGHCGVSADGDRLARIVERCHIGFLDEQRDKFDPRLRRLGTMTPGGFIRRGRAGDGRDVFTARQEALLARQLRRLTAGLGSPDDDLKKVIS